MTMIEPESGYSGKLSRIPIVGTCRFFGLEPEKVDPSNFTSSYGLIK